MANTTILCPTLPVIFQRTGDVVDTKYETSRFLAYMIAKAESLTLLNKQRNRRQPE